MGESIIVRKASRADAGTIRRFLLAMARESEGRELDVDTVDRGLGHILDAPGFTSYRIAEINGEPAGQLLLTREWSDWRAGWFWWIQSVYVQPAFRRRGVFQGLYHHVLDEAKACGDVCGLRLYVERDNARAIRAYEGLGMSATHYAMYEMAVSMTGAAS